MTGIALRGVALLIALAAFVDPTISSRRGARPDISVIGASPEDSAFAERIARDLSGRFEVARAPVPGAVATVVAGDALPAARELIASPVVAVSSVRAVPLAIEALHVPAEARVGGRIAIVAAVRARGARVVNVTLRANGLVVGRAELRPDSTEHVTARLSYAPVAAGAVKLRVTAEAGGASTTADAAVRVTDARLPLLFYDARASWASTFVRRAAERDARLSVSSRVNTSRGISRDVGSPPGQLSDADASLFNAIVVGAPDALSAADVDGLDRFMRRRGGAVVLLLDGASPGAALERLTGAARWDSAAYAPAAATELRADDSSAIRATMVAWPAVLPAGAEALVSSNGRPVVWRAAVGAGELIVSGAVDAWRLRDLPGFDQFWQSLLGRAAGNAMPTIAVDVAPSIVRPCDSAAVIVTLRDAMVRGVGQAGVSAMLGSESVRLWPTTTAGEFRGAVRAPGGEGTYSLDVTVNGSRVSAPVIVSGTAHQPQRIAPTALAAWVASRHGAVLADYRAADVMGAIDRVRAAGTLAAPWHPMRSAWWMLPFAAALSLEWWLRRRRGLK